MLVQLLANEKEIYSSVNKRTRFATLLMTPDISYLLHFISVCCLKIQVHVITIHQAGKSSAGMRIPVDTEIYLLKMRSKSQNKYADFHIRQYK